MTAFSDLLDDAALSPTDFSRLPYQRRASHYELGRAASFYRTVHLMKTILGIDPIDEFYRTLVGDQWHGNSISSGAIGIEMPTGPLWFREENGTLVVDLHEQYGGAEKSYIVTSLEDIAKVVKKYPPYGWHFGDDDKEHEYTDENCLICTPRGEEVC